MIPSVRCRGLRNRHRKGGFTLVEVLLASALGATAIALAMTTFLSLSYAASGSIAYAEMSRNLRHSANVMTRDLLPAKSIISYNPSSFVFFTRKTPGGDTYMFFYKTGDKIMRWDNGTYGEVAGGVNSIAFKLYDKNGVATTTPADAQSLDFTLRAVTTVLRNQYADQLTTRIFLRNRLQ